MPDHLHFIVHFPPADVPIPVGRAVSPLTAAIDEATDAALECECGGEGTRRPTMPTHEQRRPAGMTKTIADWKHYLTRMTGLAFQRDFFDTRIRDDAHYAEKFRYVCANPVRKNLVATPRDWPHVIAFDRATGAELPHRWSAPAMPPPKKIQKPR